MKSRSLVSLFWTAVLAPALLAGLVACSSGPKTGGTGAGAVAAVEAGGAYPVMQGVTGATWTRFTVLRPKGETLVYRVTGADGASVGGLRQGTHEFAASDQVVDEIHVQGLPSEAALKFRIERNGQAVDEREFGLRPGRAGLRFAVVSCSDDHYADEQKVMWSHLLAQAPDFIFAIGDNVYADVEGGKYMGDATPDLLWRRYVQTRSNLLLFRAKRLVPVIALWDDHDYGQNDGDRRYSQQLASLQIFKSFFPQDVDRDLHFSGPGAASAFGFGEQRFYFLDGRSFRSPNREPAICRTKKDAAACAKRPRKDRGVDRLARREPETHFGRLQESWLDKLLERGGSDVAWLITGDQWFGAYSPFESFESNHPNDFKRFLARLKEQGARVVFVSGDRHASEISKIEPGLLGFETLEIVSSPVHARVYPSNWIEFPNPRQIAAVAEAFNYTLIDSRVDNQKWEMKIRNYKLNGSRGPLSLGFEQDFLIERPIAE